MYDMLKNCSGVILAGGENRRMPVLKALIEVDGQKIIERNINIMKRLFKQVFIVTNQPEVYVYLGIPLLGEWVFISACDMPFINKNVIKYMYSQKNNFDAVVPIVKGKTEPLLAFYSKRLLPTMEKVILTDKRGIKDFLKNKRVKYVTSKEIKKIDPEAKSFANLNTPEDVNFYLLPQDRLKFKRKIKRR
jgi:molybdopterin-guanine dinucleotide biosynthesis protein A